MNVILCSPEVRSLYEALPAKAEAHRALIAAALSDGPTDIICPRVNDDIIATARCLEALGARIESTDIGFSVSPIRNAPERAVLDVGMSGSTLRFMLPVATAFCPHVEFQLHGRLPDRPLSPLREQLESCGVRITGKNPLCTDGLFRGGELEMCGSVSSQFISGALMALSLTGGSLTVTGRLESKPYVEMTVGVFELFGADIKNEGQIWRCERKSRLCSARKFRVCGDYSDAAFFLVAGTVGNTPVTVTGLDEGSLQGDREIIDAIRKAGGRIERSGSSVTAYPSETHGIEIDISDIPDLSLPLAVLFAASEGEAVFKNINRLRYKESDRVQAITDMLSALGVRAYAEGDRLTVVGGRLRGGTVDSREDHRVAMAAAVASVASGERTVITGAECVSKSHPGFFYDMFGMEV